MPPTSAESSVASVTLPIKASEVKASTRHIFKFGNRPAILIRTARGDLRAYSGDFYPLELHGAVRTRPRAHLVRVPRRALRPQRPQHPGASAAPARDVRGQRAERRDRRDEDLLRDGALVRLYSRAFAPGSTRVGLTDLAKIARKKEIPIHRHSIWYYLGGMTLFLFAVQVVTGILLLLGLPAERRGSL